MRRPTLDTTTQTPWLLPVRMIAEISSKSDATVRWAIANGQLVAYKQPDGRGQFYATRQAVADWLGVPLSDVRNRCFEETSGDDLSGEAA